ncbi:hypothetical protein D3P08_15850 [Paenibacillus nanensis]|uniref:Uncharacterized protein n=1 Tax=Paenibacillus nanensis TaxID=393251 RepID=A0A3A1UYJ0_9BACL|nr:hypothetical protein D3P08_15850 [Paenibacillus nanensis]
MSTYLIFMYYVVLIMVYGIVGYRIFILKTSKWIRENIGLLAITFIITLISDFEYHIKTLIFILSTGLLLAVLYRAKLNGKR